MRTRNLTPFAFAAKVTSREPPKPEAALVVRGTFAIVNGGVATIPEGLQPIVQGALSGELFAEEDEARAGEAIRHDDFADWKPRAEILFTGDCHAPNGKSVVECPVRIAVGAWSKTLMVFGDREWKDGLLGAKTTDPRPFTRMRLDYAHAFGGPGFGLNPVGKGFGARALPNVELAADRLTTPKDERQPATFAPVSSNWPWRRRLIGTNYGPSYAARAPFFAEDFSFDYFQSAPPDQVLPKYLAGDEAVTLTNLHPEHATLTTKLPGLRVRAFVKSKDGRFREVKMQLDTLFIDGEKCQIELTWRGLDRVDELDMIDLTTGLVASEAIGEAPLPVDHYRALLEEAERDPIGTWALPPDVRELAEKAKAVDPKAPKGAAIADVASAGMNDNDAATTKAGVLKAIEESGGDGPDGALAKAAKDAAEAPMAAAPPNVGDELRAIREATARRLETIEDPVMREKVRASIEDALAKAGPKPTKPLELADLGPERDLHEADLRGRDLRAIDLHGSNLERAVFAKASVAGGNLAGAKLKGAIFEDADLSDVDLTGADLTDANFVGAKLAGAKLDKTKLDRTIFLDADLGAASFVEAKGEMTTFSSAKLAKAKLAGADLERAAFDRANLDGADLRGARIVRGLFLEAKLTHARLDDATLEKSSFSNADVSGAKLVGAHGRRTVWLDARLDGADLSYGDFIGAHFTGSKLDGTRLFGANLREARFYRATISGADFTRANLFGADLGKARVEGTKFIGASLYDAKLAGATMRGCDLQGANVKRAVMK